MRDCACVHDTTTNLRLSSSVRAWWEQAHCGRKLFTQRNGHIMQLGSLTRISKYYIMTINAYTKLGIKYQHVLITYNCILKSLKRK